MRRLSRVMVLIVAALALCALLGGCALLVAEGRCEITGWEQEYYEVLAEYSSFVEVRFKVTNTGSIDIDYYKVWFEVRCADGSTFQEWTNGLGVSPGTYVTDSTLIDVARRQASSVRVSKFEVEN